MDEPVSVYEGFVERKVREAIAAGHFDELPGAGKPLRMRHSRDANWWLRCKIEDEQLDVAELFYQMRCSQHET
ncbi:MAG: DUF1992 domain-containing protein [Propionibacteriaceae bacterium]|jgi:hypothetical protein|nr:DUF1992 domain-containing protein [Propionibacteriaceae bacterium]